MHLVDLRERFGTRAPIPYVQAAILNLRHPYIVIATAITDTSVSWKINARQKYMFTHQEDK